MRGYTAWVHAFYAKFLACITEYLSTFYFYFNIALTKISLHENVFLFL